MNEEIFDVVDANDHVIGRLPRSEVHARKLLHRAVNIFVFNARGELYVQKRSAAKDEYPLCYTSSASGHLSAGETYDECAPRELEEELGLRLPLESLARFAGGPETAYEHTILYRAVTDDLPTPDPGEIESGSFRSLEDISAEMAQFPERFTPPFRVLFQWYCSRETGGQSARALGPDAPEA